MPFDPFKFLKGLEDKHPKTSRCLTMAFLSRLSPFNNHLGAKLLDWTDNRCLIFVKKRRRVQNHVGSIHAGALFTLGETCAGLVIIRNFPFAKFRPLMSDVKVNYSKQARSDVWGECVAADGVMANAHRIFDSGEVPTIEMTTNISGMVNGQKEIIAVVTTVWQVKPWGLVKTQKKILQ